MSEAAPRRVPIVRDISRGGGARFGIALLLVLVLVAGTGNLWATYAMNTHFEQQIEQSRAAQQAQGAVTEEKICTTLGKLAALRPPVGSASANPSRAYDQELHSVLASLGPDLGCPEK